MIDVCVVVHRNYDLYFLQVEHWNSLGVPNVDWRLLVCDNTPGRERRPLPETPGVHVYVADLGGIDGETHGAALDLLKKHTTSAIIGICDSDFFWLKRDILTDVVTSFSSGIRCFGCAGWYDDWQTRLDPLHPQRAGHLAPVCWGMFVERKLALTETFVVTQTEAAEIRETGWRLREKIVREKIPCHVLPGFRFPEQVAAQDDAAREACFFGTPEGPFGVHFLQGSARRAHLTSELPQLIAEGMRRWPS